LYVKPSGADTIILPLTIFDLRAKESHFAET